ncbi:MAG: signal peptidase II [Anaerolineae bacterium]|nr:signal peptidase II [Anaerolineae bacterium]
MSKTLKRWGLYVGVILLVIAIDQAVEQFVVTNLQIGETWDGFSLFDGFITLTHSHNSGAAFGLFPIAANVFLILAIITVIGFTVFYPTLPDYAWMSRLGLAMTAGGALGNALDRIVYDGIVIDYVNVRLAPNFSNVSNLSDHMIVLGVAFLLVDQWLEERRRMQDELKSETIPGWWKDAVGYQIYPRSYADSTGDGIGDLPGMIEKLGYLKWLGIDAIWLSPFYPSPLFDVGYDIADYINIAPEYGTLEDFDRLLEEAHQRDIHIIIDLVLNHTSDEHPWFVQSRSDRDNPYRDWYIWRDGKEGGPPNDWVSTFGGPAWTFDEPTGQYYYHFFFERQPDLNWRNPEVKQVMFDVIRFWLDRGVDGFRLDAIGTIYEVEDLPNSDFSTPATETWLKRLEGEEWVEAGYDERMRYQIDLPENHTLMQELRTLIDSYDDRLLLGEVRKVEYYGNGIDELHSIFNFDLSDINRPDALAIKKLLAERLPTVPAGGWECNTFGNHDRSRSPHNFADGKYDRRRYEQGLALIMFLPGTPIVYYGEEIGMRNWPVTTLDGFRDGLGLFAYNLLVEHGVEPDEAVKRAQQYLSRDKCRTPMQWADAPNGGFSLDGAATWLPVNPDYADGINVADQRTDPGSLLHTVRRLAQVRRANIALRRGEFELLDTPDDVLAFRRIDQEQTCIVVFNMSDQPVTLKLGRRIHTGLFSNVEPGRLSIDFASLSLAAYEVIVVEE